MGYDRKVYDEANSIIRERRNNALKNADLAKQRFFRSYPEAEQLEKELSSTLTKITKIMIKGGMDLKEALERLREENLSTQAKLREIYKRAGIDEKDLEPKHHCSLCEDVGNIDGRMCICYKQLVKEIACNNLNKLSPFKLSTFDTFELKYYSDAPQSDGNISDRERMGKYFEYCKSYAEGFTEEARNIFMRGNTGLGKTHLSLAIGRAVIEKGFGVIYCSTPEILAKLEKEHFGKTKTDEDSEETLKECDLLILDDLGSEFHTSFTKNKIYNIINFRLIHQKPTIISTNLDYEELENAYSKRLISRLLGEYVIMSFVGTDIRQAKRLEKYK
ncbi:MAG: ATP-binding protein [Acutalibacteraceae bacterium]|nr:ATP-binding protein [Acutalibacteraceae bacterium]